MFANQTTTLNTTAGLLTQTLRFPQLVIESPHCLIGNRMTPQPDLKHLLKLVGTSALPFKNKNYIIKCVKWRLVFWWISGNESTPGLSEHRAIRDVFRFTVSTHGLLPRWSIKAEAGFVSPLQSPNVCLVLIPSKDHCFSTRSYPWIWNCIQNIISTNDYWIVFTNHMLVYVW